MVSGAKPLVAIAPLTQAALVARTVPECGDTVFMVAVSFG